MVILSTYKITFKITSQFRPNFTISAKFHSFSKPGILGISGIPEIPGILGIPGMRTVSQILRCFFWGGGASLTLTNVTDDVDC